MGTVDFVELNLLFVTKSSQREPSPLSPKVAKENRPLCHLFLFVVIREVVEDGEGAVELLYED